MKLVCRLIVLGFAAFYLFALAILAIGTLGLFGSDTDPLSGVYLIPLGFPWVIFVDLAPEPLWPWLAALSPAVNLLVLIGFCHFLKRRKA